MSSAARFRPSSHRLFSGAVVLTASMIKSSWAICEFGRLGLSPARSAAVSLRFDTCGEAADIVAPGVSVEVLALAVPVSDDVELLAARNRDEYLECCVARRTWRLDDVGICCVAPLLGTDTICGVGAMAGARTTPGAENICMAADGPP